MATNSAHDRVASAVDRLTDAPTPAPAARGANTPPFIHDRVRAGSAERAASPAVTAGPDAGETRPFISESSTDGRVEVDTRYTWVARRLIRTRLPLWVVRWLAR